MAEPSRAERLFEATKNLSGLLLSWKEGVKWFRQRRTLTKTVQTHLATLEVDSTSVLSPGDKDALAQARAVLARLNGDYELAERLAKRYVEEKEAEHAKSEQERLQATADRLVGPTVTEDEIVLWVEDIASLVAMSHAGRGEAQELKRIVGTDAGLRGPLRFTFGVQQLHEAISAGKPRPMPLEKARLAVAYWLACNVTGADPYAFMSSSSIERSTLEAWRAHRQRMRSLLTTSAHDPDAGDGS